MKSEFHALTVFLTALCKTRFYLFVLLLQAVSLANLLLGLGLALGLANLQNQLNDQLGNNNAQPMNMTVVLPNAGTAGNGGPTMVAPTASSAQGAALARNMEDMRRNMDRLRDRLEKIEDKSEHVKKGSGNFNRFCHRVSSCLDYRKQAPGKLS